MDDISFSGTLALGDTKMLGLNIDSFKSEQELENDFQPTGEFVPDSSALGRPTGRSSDDLPRVDIFELARSIASGSRSRRSIRRASSII
ncbi:hypothetical protein BH10ACI3_BH10ACI3_09150 [soil metagenome]